MKIPGWFLLAALAAAVYYIYNMQQEAAAPSAQPLSNDELADYYANGMVSQYGTSDDGAYLTVPGAVGLGVGSITGMISGLSSLFSSYSS